MARGTPVVRDLLISALLILPPHVSGQEEGVQARVDAVFTDVSTEMGPGCAVSVMREGSPVFEQGYGKANLEYDVPITPHSVFHVASVSKQFTAMAIELLVNEGKVSWDDDIRQYVPEVPDFGTPITLRHLVHHVSGIRDQWNLLLMAGWRWEADVVTQKDVLEITSRQTGLNFEPGERYLYSNTGFTLLAVVVERVTGKSLREFAGERIFDPLGMEETHFHDDHEMIVPNRAWAYAPDPEGIYGYRISIPDFDVVGATSLFTTVHDMAAWDRNFYTGQVGGSEALTRIRQPFTLNAGEQIDYAHGLTLGSFRGLPTEGHGGSDAGYRSHFLRFPEQGLSVAVLCNFPDANPGDRAQRVAEVYLGDLMEEPRLEDPAQGDEEPLPMSAEDLLPLAGVYRGEAPSEVLRIGLGDNTLRLLRGGGLPLRPIGQHRFRLGDTGPVMTFGVSEEDRNVALEFQGRRFEREDAWNPAPGELAEFEGTYHSEELGTDYHFTMEGDTLWFHHRKMESRRLEPAFRDGFLLRNTVLDFTRDPAGNVNGFTVSDGRVWKVRFQRVRG